MNWLDIAMLMASATLANHMGLVEAVEKTIGFKLPIINCPKCCSFWLTLCYTLLCGVTAIHSVAISFLMAYLAIWFNLILGLADRLYNWIYESAFTTQAADPEDTETTVS